MAMKQKGVDVLQTGKLDGEKGEISYVLFKTFNEGKYALGLSYSEKPTDPANALNSNNMKFSQVAFAVNDISPVRKYCSTAAVRCGAHRVPLYIMVTYVVCFPSRACCGFLIRNMEKKISDAPM